MTLLCSDGNTEKKRSRRFQTMVSSSSPTIIVFTCSFYKSKDDVRYVACIKMLKHFRVLSWMHHK